MQNATTAVEPIVGIDLGTTNSLVAVAMWPLTGDAAARAPRVLPDDAGLAMCPSVVRFGEGEPVVGVEAKQRAAEFPLTTVGSVKRLMGRSLADAAGDLPYLSYKVVAGPAATARVEVPVGDGVKVVSPQEVSAYVLRALREQASARLGVPVRKAVVTVPAYFDDAQRQATRDAGRIAGLEVVRIVNEPTAAALAYGLGLRAGSGLRDQVIVVYDFGGGTFDVSVLRLVAGEAGGGAGGEAGPAAAADAFQVLSTAGDTHLGGDDVDHLVMQWLLGEIAAEAGQEIAAVPGVRSAVQAAAERAKIALSDAESTEVVLPLPGGRRLVRVLGRGQLEAMIMPLVERTLECCKRAMRDAAKQLAGESVSAVVMVGGSTRIPLVRRRVAEVFGCEPYTAVDPDQVVALGAAVQAGVLMQQQAGLGRSAVLLDVLPLSLGLETVGGAVAKLIFRNSATPCRASEMFSTSVDGQTSIKLSVLQGEREMAADCRLLGTFHLRGIPPMPAGIPQVRVEFAVDANGVLSVSAVEQRSGKRAAVQIVPNHGLSAEEVERIELESFKHAREDMTRHRIADLIANSALDLHWINRQLKQHAAKLETASREQLEGAVTRLSELAAAARQDWRSVSADEFHKVKESLDRASMRLHEVAIAESLRSQNIGDR